MNERTAGHRKSRVEARDATTNDKKTSRRKVAANRENAKRSTGPRTERGKSYSRLNALKHGILASVAVSEVLEGRAERDLFDQMVDGLAEELKPVGWREELLVQDIANCYWSRRKLIQYEQDLAFKRHQDIIADELDVAGANSVDMANPFPKIRISPRYMMARYNSKPMIGSGGEARETAGLEIPTLPHPAELAIVARYRAMLNRERERLMREFEYVQTARCGREGGENPRSVAEARGGFDEGAGYRNLHRNCYALPMDATMDIYNNELKKLSEDMKVTAERLSRERAEEDEPELEEEAAAEEGEDFQDGDLAENLENYQTKPKKPRRPKTLSPEQPLSEPGDGDFDDPESAEDPGSGG